MICHRAHFAALLASGLLLASPVAHAGDEGIPIVTQGMMAADEIHHRPVTPAIKAERAQQAERELDTMKRAMLATLCVAILGSSGGAIYHLRSSRNTS